MIEDYGHWSVLKEVDLKTVIGFVYVITFDNGKKYVGAKKIWKRITTPPCKFKTVSRQNKCEQSDWREYTSSSKEVNSMIDSGVYPKEYLIVGWYETWGKTLLAEALLQINNDVLRSDVWLNKQIGGHFNPNCFDDFTEEDIANYIVYKNGFGNSHVLNSVVMYKLGYPTKYVNETDVVEYLDKGWNIGRSPLEKRCAVTITASFDLFDTIENKLVHVNNLTKFAKDNGIPISNLSVLINGGIDILQDRWTLDPKISRKNKVIRDPDGNEFSSIAECDAHHSFPRGRSSYLANKKDSGFVKLKAETRKQYKDRLLKHPVKTLSRYINTEIAELNKDKEQNSVYKDIVRSLLKQSHFKDTDECLEWLKAYTSYLETTCK